MCFRYAASLRLGVFRCAARVLLGVFRYAACGCFRYSACSRLSAFSLCCLLFGVFSLCCLLLGSTTAKTHQTARKQHSKNTPNDMQDSGNTPNSTQAAQRKTLNRKQAAQRKHNTAKPNPRGYTLNAVFSLRAHCGHPLYRWY